MPSFEITSALQSHIKDMVALSYEKRKAYEEAQPLFWKEAEDSNSQQEAWFVKLIQDPKHIVLVTISSEEKRVIGFIIGALIDAPAVYDPGGKTLMVDDFCVASSTLWKDVGGALLAHLQKEAFTQGAVQTLVVCGEHDDAKKAFLEKEGLRTASRWYVRGKLKPLQDNPRCEASKGNS